jgi:hypothetical protein
LTAYGTAAAIAEVIGGRKTKALSKFSRAVRPYNDEGVSTTASSGDSADMGTLRSRIHSAMKAGELD